MLDNMDKENLTPQDENIIDVTIEGVKKQKFRINGGAILELDTSDLNIVTRLKTIYPKLSKLANEATSKIDIADDMPVDEQLDKMADVLKDIDTQMREWLDFIFDANVSEVCAPTKSLYSPHGGKFTYEHIAETLAGLYGGTLEEEAKRLSHRLRQHTDKYTGGGKRK